MSESRRPSAPKMRIQSYNVPRLYRIVAGRGRSFRVILDGLRTKDVAIEALAALSKAQGAE